jgi:hypothetical protein
MAVTRVWDTSGINGVPVGIQIATPLCTTNGWPLDVTLTVPTAHCAVTQGGNGGGTSGHPATSHGMDANAVGCALTITRGFGAVGTAWPPWLHITVAP